MNPTLHVGLTARRSPETVRRSSRRALTVIELLVVMTIMALLAAIVAVVAPKFSDGTRVAEGARQFTSWLQTARQRAQRDKAPRGLRILDAARNELKRFAYVEQPEDISAVAYEIYPFRNDPPYMFGNTPPAQMDNKRMTQRAAFQTAAAGQFPANSPYWNLLHPTKNADGWKYLVYLPGKNLTGAVNTGDVIEFAGARYSIICPPVQVGSADPTNGCVLVINRSRDEFRPNSLDIAILPALPPIRITRSPRPIAGEPELTLPSNIAIDLSRCVLGNSTGGGGGVFDIVFAPSGDAIGAAGATGRVIFWMRDLSLVDPGANTMPDGDNRLVVLHCRTGQVTAHSVNPEVDSNLKLTDPYKFVRDGKSSAQED